MNQNSECDIVEEKFTKLLDYVETKISRKNGGVQKKYTTLEAMGLVLNKAASIYGKDWSGFLDATTYVFTGYYGHGDDAMLEAHSGDFSGYFEGDSGFHQDFKDGSNQVRHFWAAFATAADPYGDNPNGKLMAQIGNWWHDGATDGVGNDGVTIMDYELSATAIDLASEGGKTIANPSDLASVLINALGPNGGPNYSGPQASPNWWLTPYY